MWRSFWRSVDRFSLQHFKYVIHELREIKIVDYHNRELVVDLLQSIVEIVTYGDRQDPQIFECFMEYQVLAEFVRVLKIGGNARIEAPLLQYLSIMIQNMDTDHAIYYCLSNDHINSIIAHEYNFDSGGDLAQYYVSFLRAVSSKINRDMLCLLVKVQGDVVVSFPLYSEALTFALRGEEMIQTAVRALTLNIYNVSDDMVYQFITTPPASKYFSDLVHSLKEQCVHLDSIVHDTKEIGTKERRKELLSRTAKIVDDLYYFKDILSIGESRLSKLITENVLNLLVYPILFNLLQVRHTEGSNISAITSLYIVSHLLQVVGEKYIIDFVADMVLRPYVSSSASNVGESATHTSFINRSKSQEAETINGDHPSRLLQGCISSESHFVDYPADDNVCPERSGIVAYILSDNHSLLLASVFLLLTIAESKELHPLKASMVGLTNMQPEMVVGGSLLGKFQPQILSALLKVLASEPPISALIQWHTGWFLQKLLDFHGKSLDDQNLQLFATSYQQSRQRFQKELDGCWFDFVLYTFRSEWAICKKALEGPFQSKDPFFLLELAICCQSNEGDETNSSYVAWQKMVQALKVFVLHLQLKAFVCKEKLLEYPLQYSNEGSPDGSGRTYTSDHSSASFGSEVFIGPGIPCRIAFSNAGIRDIYLIPVARGTSGKLLIAEKHPFRSQRGVVIAIAPLAGLSPKIDKDHPTWLHLRIREFDPRLNISKTRSYNSKVGNPATDGRWTLGFSNAKTCEAARLVILEETSKQRSAVNSAIAPLLQDVDLGNLAHSRDV